MSFSSLFGLFSGCRRAAVSRGDEPTSRGGTATPALPVPGRPGVRRLLSRLARWTAAMLLMLLVFTAALGALALHALRPGPGDWSHTWRVPLPWGHFERELSMPVLLRWATHPLAGVLLDGRTLHTRGGSWRLHHASDDTIEADCAPCTVHLPALGRRPLQLTRARLLLRHLNPDQWQGVLRLGEGAAVLPVAWRAQLRQDALEVRAELPRTPVADAVAVFGAAIPEARQARIAGELAFRLDARWSTAGLSVTRLVPTLDGVRVAGLGTEALIAAEAPAPCLVPRGNRLEGWLPHAVVAAEDQRFHEHQGYDLAEWLLAWRENPGRVTAPLGASTLTQQLAKLLYTGDERSAARKLREWLYAVEMERTLGKGRILQLYLAVAPWGNGLCGAEAAARHYLGKAAHRLAPHEAAWLASLLIHPDLQARRWAAPQAADTERVARIVGAMHRLPKERRTEAIAALDGWRPARPGRPPATAHAAGAESERPSPR